MNITKMKNFKDDCENNERGEITGTKCGEIFTTESEIFNVLCTFCRTILEDIDEFKVHFQTNHNNQFEDDVEIKIEELSNDDTLVDPIGQCMDAEDCVEALESASIVNLESIIEQNVDNQTTIKIEDRNIFKDNSSEYLSEELEEKSNTYRPKSQKRKGNRIAASHYCEICDKFFQRGSILKTHKIYDHTPTYSFVDNLQNESNLSKNNQLHNKQNFDSLQSVINDPLKCRYCGRRFRNREFRFEHECIHTGERPFKCTICEKTFRSKRILQGHMHFHENKREFKCEICGNGFNSSINLKIHLRRHNNEKAQQCSYCDERFLNPKDKSVHEGTHTDENPHQFTVCGEEYVTDSKLDYHFLNKQNSLDDLSEKSNISDKPQKRKSSRISTLHVCDICNKSFHKESILDSHKRCDHNPTYSFVDNLNNETNSFENNGIQDRLNLDPSQSEDNDPLKCRYCGRRFRRRGIRFEHECLHTGERPFKCTICEKTFRVKNTLKAHMHFHENKREFKCEICGNGFNSSINLKIHLRRHNNEKPHKCSYCDKRFVYTTDKQSHERIHTGEKPYQCTECGQQYSTSSRLGLHFRKKHVPQTPVKCENCDKTFMSKERLKVHQAVHNKDYRPYKCDVCDATFSRRDGITQHKKLHSDVLQYTCNICGKSFKQFAGLYSHKKTHGENIAFQKAYNEN